MTCMVALKLAPMEINMFSVCHVQLTILYYLEPCDDQRKRIWKANKIQVFAEKLQGREAVIEDHVEKDAESRSL